jgi:hypothetical protein
MLESRNSLSKYRPTNPVAPDINSMRKTKEFKRLFFLCF